MTGSLDDYLDENGEEIDAPDAGDFRHASGASGDAPPTSPVIASAAALRTKIFPPLQYVVPGYVPEGLTLFAGRPKIGKSWWLLQASLAVSSGKPWWDSEPCEPSDVLYLALEDNERRLQSRITKLVGYSQEWPARLDYATEWPRMDNGGLHQIRRWLDKAPNPRLVNVDVVAKIRAPRGTGQSPYESDYAAVSGLQRIASDYRVAIIGACHLRKQGAEIDPFEKVSNTFGFTGAADTVLILDRDSNGVTLYGRGRDIPEIEKAVRFDNDSCQWLLLGEAEEARRTNERSKILSVLIEAPEPMSPKEIADCTGMNANNVTQLLFKMLSSGEVSKSGRGRYVHPSKTGAAYAPQYER